MFDFTVTTALIVALAVLLVIDWRQTLVIAQPGGWYERWNPITRWLIAHLGAAGVHLWFVVACTALAAALYLLPDWRREIAAFWVFVELAATGNNYWVGIRP